jgi:hypothetical protein
MYETPTPCAAHRIAYRNMLTSFYFILQGHAIAWTVISRYKGTFVTKYGVLTVNRVFGEEKQRDKLTLAYHQALSSSNSSTWSVTNTINLAL